MKKPTDKPQKIIVILGQTAVGKSDFAVQIGKDIKGEIISADSRQVYKGMDLGTGKITKKEMSGVPHHLIDIVSPKKVFSVSDFKKLAEKKIKEISARGNVPIVCGGTGFYIDTLLGNSLPEVPPNKKLRKELGNKSADELFQILEKLDNIRAENIDKKNPVRLIRAIEIATLLGSVPMAQNRASTYDVLKIGLTLPDEILKKKIHERLFARIKKGMLREIKKLHDEGISWKRMNELGLEYRYGALYLQKLSRQKTKKYTPSLAGDRVKIIEKLSTEIWRYAKRQKTWFKRDKDIIWIDPREIHEQAKVLKKIKEFLE